MNENEIRNNIEERILEINEAFPKRMMSFYSENFKSDDIESLEKILKRVSKSFVFYKICTIFFISLLWIVSFLTFFIWSGLHLNLNKAGLFIICTLPFVTNTFWFFKLKVNVENKIYLLRLLERMNGE